MHFQLNKGPKIFSQNNPLIIGIPVLRSIVYGSETQPKNRKVSVSLNDHLSTTKGEDKDNFIPLLCFNNFKELKCIYIL